jgi:hypothetical protein
MATVVQGRAGSGCSPRCSGRRQTPIHVGCKVRVASGDIRRCRAGAIDQVGQTVRPNLTSAWAATTISLVNSSRSAKGPEPQSTAATPPPRAPSLVAAVNPVELAAVVTRGAAAPTASGPALTTQTPQRKAKIKDPPSRRKMCQL